MVFRPDHAAGAIAAFRQVQILTSRLSRAAVQSGNVFGINVRHLSLHGFRLFIHDTDCFRPGPGIQGRGSG